MKINQTGIMKQEDYDEERTWKDCRYLLAKCILHFEGKQLRRILDIGCGLGQFIICCQAFGLEAFGLEASEYAISKLKSQEFKICQTDLKMGN